MEPLQKIGLRQYRDLKGKKLEVGMTVRCVNSSFVGTVLATNAVGPYPVIVNFNLQDESLVVKYNKEGQRPMIIDETMNLKEVIEDGSQ